MGKYISITGAMDLKIFNRMISKNIIYVRVQHPNECSKIIGVV